MALRATERAKTPAGASIPSRTKGSRSAHVEMLSTPLDLAPLVAPYRKFGKLSFRVERMPQTTRLSQGRNNGNGSYSLQFDELHGLEYVFPEGMGADTPVLSLRIVGLDQDGATLAIVDVEVPPYAGRPGDAGSNVDQGLLQRQREEMEGLRRTLAEREKELAQARRKSESPSPEAIHQQVEEALAEARDAWNLELEQHLSAAEAQAASLIEQSRKIWAAEQDVRFAEARENWRQESEQALVDLRTRCERAEAARKEAQANPPKNENSAEVKALRDDLAALRTTLAVRDKALTQAKIHHEDAELRWRHQNTMDIDAAKEAVKAEAAAQLAQVKTEWEQSATRALAEVNARLQKAEAALLDASDASQSNDGEVRKLRDEVAAAQAALGARDRAVADARNLAESNDAELRHLREELAAANASVAAYEKSLTDARDQTQSSDSEMRKLRDELAAVSAEHEKALAEALNSGRSKDQDLHALREQLASAQATASDRERALSDARSIAASNDEDLRRLREDLAAAKASFPERERSLTETQNAAQSDDGETQGLREDLAAARAMLEERDKSLTVAQAAKAEREAEIDQLREELRDVKATDHAAGVLETKARDAARATWQKEHDDSLAAAKDEWETAGAKQLAAAEAEWKAHYAETIAQLSARLAEAEAGQWQSAQGAPGAGDDEELMHLRQQVTELQIKLAQKENEIEHARLSLGSDGASHHISIGSEFMRNREQDDESRERRKATIRLVIEMAAAAALAGSIAIFYPRVIAMLPDEWVYQIDNASEGIKTAIFGYPPITTTATPAPAVQAAASGSQPQQTAEIVHGGNLRSGPNGSAAIVMTLQRGQSVAVLQRHDDWTQIGVKMTDGTKRQGWIFSSFLKPAGK